MRIAELSIRNFRGITNVQTGLLGDTIIVAGQNGSGKSCIFDAIRLLKSVYGGYQQNEYQHFFTEFQIQLHGESTNLKGLFNDRSKPIDIECRFELRDREKAFISGHASELLEGFLWQKLLPEAFQYGGYRKAMFAAQFRDRKPEVAAHITTILPQLLTELALPHHIGRVRMTSRGEMEIHDSIVLSVVFSSYQPRDIGVIDFHGAQRHYNREMVQGINLSLDAANQTKSQSSLYNYNAKYNNVKSEMAGNYIKALLSEKAGTLEGDDEESLAESMKELFAAFFPDKEFLGPTPTKDGSLEFPVKTQNGTVHDLDELSSGEKEILYGYLRIRSSAPRDSIILLDEPELHLNPRLIRGLPEFYRLHLGEGLQNQLWLVTHSDALIREAVGKPGFNVFHMLPCGSESAGQSQLKPLVEVADTDLVITDLVGDLASYRPGGKGVIFEGGGDSDFDKTLVSTLFTEEVRGFNLISGSNKAKVRALHEVLSTAYSKGDFPTKFYSVVDRDTERQTEIPDGVTQFAWDVYHIENYLLESSIIAELVNSHRLKGHTNTTEIDAKLAIAARSVVPAVLIHQMKIYANTAIVSCVDLSFDPATLLVSEQLKKAVDRSYAKIELAVNGLSKKNLDEKESALRRDIEASFGDGSWRANLPGRNILKQFVQNESIATPYETFRNQIVARMAEKGFKPEGMRQVIDKIKI